jgi:hypothetical protein
MLGTRVDSVLMTGYDSRLADAVSQEASVQVQLDNFEGGTVPLINMIGAARLAFVVLLGMY